MLCKVTKSSGYTTNKKKNRQARKECLHITLIILPDLNLLMNTITHNMSNTTISYVNQLFVFSLLAIYRLPSLLLRFIWLGTLTSPQNSEHCVENKHQSSEIQIQYSMKLKMTALHPWDNTFSYVSWITEM